MRRTWLLLLAAACATASAPARDPLPKPDDVVDAVDERCHEFLNLLYQERYREAAHLLDPSSKRSMGIAQVRGMWLSATRTIGDVVGWHVVDRGGVNGHRRTLSIAHTIRPTQVVLLYCSADGTDLTISEARFDYPGPGSSFRGQPGP